MGKRGTWSDVWIAINENGKTLWLKEPKEHEYRFIDFIQQGGNSIEEVEDLPTEPGVYICDISSWINECREGDYDTVLSVTKHKLIYTWVDQK